MVALQAKAVEEASAKNLQNAPSFLYTSHSISCLLFSMHFSLFLFHAFFLPFFSAPCLSRPGLQGMVGGLQAKAVEEASSKAFAAMPDIKEALKEMTVLRGVGPATASALLAAHSPSVAPIMSDEVCPMQAFQACTGRSVLYSTIEEDSRTVLKGLAVLKGLGCHCRSPAGCALAQWYATKLSVT